MKNFDITDNIAAKQLEFSGSLEIDFKNIMKNKLEILQVDLNSKFFFSGITQFSSEESIRLNNLYPGTYSMNVIYKLNGKRKIFQKNITIEGNKTLEINVPIENIIIKFPKNIKSNQNTTISWNNLSDNQNLKVEISVGYIKNKNKLNSAGFSFLIADNIPSKNKKFVIDKKHLNIGKNYKNYIYIQFKSNNNKIVKSEFIYFNIIE
ncbi:hypothetical protein AAEX28_00150 [Lentisphaerota bacterium WC36G]|nr:hypothetical protein LJT99_03025 [Lentisphaerae bacterium WC36]